jgi:hypothetical protein
MALKPPARAGDPTCDRAGLDSHRSPQLVPSGPAVVCGAICAKTTCRAGFPPGPRSPVP